MADLGGISFGGAADVIDLNGLANHRSALALLSPFPNFPEFMRLIEADEAPIAILYSDLHELAYGPIPDEWELIGRWRIRQDVAAGSNVVSFYALDEAQALPLRDNLEGFAPSLPATVEYALHPDWR